MFIQVLCSDPATAKKKGRNPLLQNKATPLRGSVILSDMIIYYIPFQT